MLAGSLARPARRRSTATDPGSRGRVRQRRRARRADGLRPSASGGQGRPAQPTVALRHPYGAVTIDLDGTGAGRLVEDVSPAVGNFAAALAGNLGPFLKWDPAPAPAAPQGYLGDPAIDAHDHRAARPVQQVRDHRRRP